MKDLKQIKKDINNLYAKNSYVYILTNKDIAFYTEKLSLYYENKEDFSFDLLFKRINYIEYQLSNPYEYLLSIIAGMVSSLVITLILASFDIIKTLDNIITIIIISLFFNFFCILIILFGLYLLQSKYELRSTKRRLFFNLEREVLCKILKDHYGYEYPSLS